MPAPGRVTAARSLGPPRYAGLAGSALLAVAAARAGARPGRADLDGLVGVADLPWVVAAVAGLVVLTVAWWRVDGLVREPAAGATTRWLLVTAVLWAVPPLLATPLASRDVYAYACQGAAAAAGLDPAGTAPAAWRCGWLASVPPIWRDAPSPYGPLATLVSHAAASLADGRLWLAVGVLRAVAVAGVVLAVAYGARLARACDVPVGRAAWLGVASPLVLLHVASGAHHDALMTGLVVAALGTALGRATPDTGGSSHTRDPDTRDMDTCDPDTRDVDTLDRGGGDGGGRGRGATVRAAVLRGVLPGVVVGAAAAVKVTALVAAPFVVLALLAARPQPPGGRGRPARLVGAGVGVGAGAALGCAVLGAVTGSGLGVVAALGRTGDLVQWTSPPTAVGMTVGYALRALGVPGGGAALAAVRLLALIALAVVVAVIWWRAWRAPAATARRAAVRGAGLAFVALAALGPVFYPWYALPALALLAVSYEDAGARRRLAAAATVLAFLILPDGAGIAARTKLPGALLVTAALLVAAWRLVRSREPERAS